MKVKHLIRELGKCDPEAEVMTEGGHNCYGDSYCLAIDGDMVMIRCSECAVIDPALQRRYPNGKDTPEPID